MKLHYKGKFNGDYESLPKGELEKHPNAVKFKEFDDLKKMMIIMNIIAGILTVILGIVFVVRAGEFAKISFIGMLIACLSLVPHELLHAICFKNDVDMYIISGGAFVIGTENMSKLRFVIMSMLPNVIFGIIPFSIFLIFPQYTVLGSLGFLAIPMGIGDYYNVFNALTQMPKGARCFLEKQNSYWYIPEEDDNDGEGKRG